MKYNESYAIDFDGTLHKGKWPDIGKPNTRLIRFLIKKKHAGDKLMLWTCREGELLEAAVKWCKSQGLEFDTVNDNLQENKEKFNNNTRKLFANYYIDDKNLFLKYEILSNAEDKARFYRKKYELECAKTHKTNTLISLKMLQDMNCEGCGQPAYKCEQCIRNNNHDDYYEIGLD